MNRCLLALLLIACLSTLGGAPAQAAVIFADSFDTSNGGATTLNWNGAPNWTVGGGSVDLIGLGTGGPFFDFLPGNGMYIDMDGSTGNAADAFSHAFTSLAAGTYILSFDLAGNRRNGAFESVTVSFGSYLETFDSTVFTQLTPFMTIVRTVTVGANPTLTFSASGGDNIGMLLDDVVLAEVPEPGTVSLLGAGLLFLAWAARRRA